MPRNFHSKAMNHKYLPINTPTWDEGLFATGKVFALVDQRQLWVGLNISGRGPDDLKKTTRLF
jgi:hypothetical protein